MCHENPQRPVAVVVVALSSWSTKRSQNLWSGVVVLVVAWSTVDREEGRYARGQG